MKAQRNNKLKAFYCIQFHNERAVGIYIDVTSLMVGDYASDTTIDESVIVGTCSLSLQNEKKNSF